VGTVRRTVLAAIGAVSAAAIVGGCGPGPGHGTSDVSLTVTRGFGTAQIGFITEQRVPGSETVMRMLERSFRVGTRYGGDFVQSIDGISASSSRLGWFYYVNGIAAPVGAARTALHGGDRIWWDLHDESATDSVPAVVGSFPEPFVHGSGGKRLPTTLQCATDVTASCNRVAGELSSIGVPVATQLFGTGSGTDSLGVIVGTWRDLDSTLAAGMIEHGPSASGVYARFAGSQGAALDMLDPRGRVVRTLGARAGLVAATGQGSAEPVWLITGTDPSGVAAAAAALTPSRLHDHFALAVQGHTDLPVPVQGSS
jgi:Domain of unknown function (DUF4430)